MHRLKAEGLAPSPEASRITLLRRLSLDLLGLPPSPAAVDRFLEDTRPGAYERLVERLLASPHYGERWGRHWLDVARYADSDGFSDGSRQIWMYRDWVVRSLNRDLPFDRFTIQQLAGDLIPDASKEQIVATGFHRNTLLNQEGGIDVEQYRVERVVDRVATTGAAFLGLTVGCARCHDHKYDSVSQKEFFQLYSFFNNIEERSPELEETDRPRHWPFLELGSDEEFARRDIIRSQLGLLEEELKTYEKELLARLPQWEQELAPERRREYPPEIQRILVLPAEERNEIQLKTLHLLYKEQDLGHATRKAGIDSLKQAEPKLPSTLVMKELPEPREAYIHLGGEFTRRGDTVQPDVPAVLPPLTAQSRPDRMDLAQWLVGPGTSSHRPSHREPHLATLLRRRAGGDRERLRNSGDPSLPPGAPGLAGLGADSQGMEPEGDPPADRHLGDLSPVLPPSRGCRQGGPGESATGPATPPAPGVGGGARRLPGCQRTLEPGPRRASSLPPPNLRGAAVWVIPSDPGWPAKVRIGFRRGLYTHFWRSTPHPALMVFDSPNGITTCTRRSRSTLAPAGVDPAQRRGLL